MHIKNTLPGRKFSKGHLPGVCSFALSPSIENCWNFRGACKNNSVLN